MSDWTVNQAGSFGRSRKYMSLHTVLTSTHVTCVNDEVDAYSTHLPQNLGDRGWIWSRGSPNPTLYCFISRLVLSC